MVFSTPSTRTTASTVYPSSTDADVYLTSFSGVVWVRYSSLKMCQMVSELTSPPAESVWC